LEVPLAPLNEQRRIVAKLETLLGKVDACQKRLAKIPILLKRFRQSVLAAACSGRLTADWREEKRDVESAASFVRRVQLEQKATYEHDCSTAAANGQRKPKRPKNEFNAMVDEEANGLPENWCVTRIGDISDCLDHMRVPINKTERLARRGTVPYYGANGQVGWIDDFLFDEELVLVVEDETFIGREKPFSYIITGKTWVNNHAHVLRALGGMPTEFLNICLSYYDFVPLTSGTTGRRKLTQEGLVSAPLRIAPRAEQQEIVHRVDRLFALADQIEARYAKAKAYVEKLTQSILAKAFRGELVPQDPNDEPASVLLERIRQQRNGENSSTRRSPRPSRHAKSLR
jgi:type I restriction enzyme S subunit